MRAAEKVWSVEGEAYHFSGGQEVNGYRDADAEDGESGPGALGELKGMLKVLPAGRPVLDKVVLTYAHARHRCALISR